MLISITIPLYNEEECFQEMVESLVHQLESNKIDYELVLVDNGSWDATGKMIDEAVKNNSRLKKVRIEENQGYGWGIINGLKAASGDYVGYMCGDGQIHAEDVVRMARFIIESPCDLLKVQRTKRNDGWIRFAITTLYNWTVPALFGLKTQDLNGTPKLFPRNILDQLALESKDWFIDVELMVKSSVLGLKIHEIPVVFEARQKGASHVSVFKAIFEFMRNVYRFKTGKQFKQWKKLKQSS